MTTRERALTGAVVVALVAAAGVLLWLFGATDEAPEPSEDAEAELAQWGVPEPPPRRRRRAAEGAPPSVEPRDDPERAARRERRRERWRRAVEVVSLGPGQPALEPDAIREALRPGRPALRDCIRESGGWRALREARRAERRAERPESGEGEPRERRRRRPRRTVRFEVGADGHVDPETVEFEPAMPDAFAGCFREYFSAPELPGAGPDGAAVELPMGGRRRRGRRFEGDGGVGSPRGERRRRRERERSRVDERP